jgi:hypothetical protein
MMPIFASAFFLVAAAAALCLPLACTAPQPRPESPTAASPGADGPLGYLAAIRPGRSARVSSAAPNRSSNADNRRIPPGQKLVLADIAGPGTIQHIWLTFPDPAPGWLGRDGNADAGELVLRIYWDGAAEPAVESPVGDFFAAGFGERAEVNSAPVLVEGGDAYNCYWPMPFHTSARIEIENQSSKPLNSFYFQIDYVKEESVPPGAPYFCAQYRQEMPVASGRDYLILDAQGRGHYVGTVLSVRARSPMWFGEGDDKFYIDGEKRPSLWGTGTEDYVGNAWGTHLGTYPYFGVSILEGEFDMVGWRTTIYRWHLPDPVRFTKSLRVEIEDAGWITKDELKEGVHEGFVERNDDFASVAFWYQVGQPKRFAALPPLAARRWPNLDIIIEGKDLLKTATSEGATLSLQKGYEWTGEGQIFVDNTRGAGAWVEFAFPVEKEELRQLTLRMTTSYDFGTYRILLDGKEVRGATDFFNASVKVRELNLGQMRLAAGPHKIRFECVGPSGQSKGARLGIDSVRLRERWNVKREAPKDL